MAVEIRETPSMLVIKKYKPSELSKEDYINLGLVDLVARGYGYEGTPEELLEQAGFEYGGEDERVDDYIAFEKDKAVGSLVVVHWTPSEKKRGKTFWRTLGKKDPVLRQIAFLTSPFAVDIAGVVTLPERRKEGISRKLYELMIPDLKPSFVVGQTKTVEAVLARANILGSLGYRTFIGDTEVTPQTPRYSTKDHVAVRSAYLKASGETPDKFGVHYMDPKRLSTNVPDTSRAPIQIRHALEPLRTAQKIVGEKDTAVMPLLSIWAGYLPDSHSTLLKRL